MKKKYILLILLTLLTCSCTKKDQSNNVLVIYNVEDYISNGEDDSVDLIKEFEETYDCEVKYYTYDTNETMYNQFKLQKQGTYDLVLGSEYICQKMIKEGLMDPIDNMELNIPNYYQNCSPSLRQKLQSMDCSNETIANLDQYVVGYMWGTLGIIFDPSVIEYDELEGLSWDVIYDKKYANLTSLKNSMRDAYDAGLLHGYASQTRSIQDSLLVKYGTKYCDGYRSELNAYIQDLFDFKLDGSDESEKENLAKIALVKEELCKLKDNLFGWETDSGKNDIVEGSKIKMNLAYSGDAVYSISLAKELGKELMYIVPNEGGNIWYDAWMLPKGSKNRDLAYKFLNFVSDSTNASSNMDYIGYTPFIVGEEMFTTTSSYYGASDFDINQTYYSGDHVIYNNVLYMCDISEDEEITNVYPNTLEGYISKEYDSSIEYEEYELVSKDSEIYYVTSEGLEIVNPYDLSHIYSELENRDRLIYPYYESINSLETQYPSLDVMARCGVMNDYGIYNENVIIMWGQVKAYINMTPFYIILIIVLTAILTLLAYYIIHKKKSARYRRYKQENRGK